MRSPVIGPSGYSLGRTVNDRVGFHGSFTTQPKGAAQQAITDNTTGAPGVALAAGAGVHTNSIPVVLAKITGAMDVLSAFTPGYKFKLLAAVFAVSNPVTTASKLATLGLKITGAGVTGGAVALTSANCTPLGAQVAGSAITAANTGSATDSITIAATSVTAFAEGEGYLLLKIQNMDTADAFASLNNLLGALRAADAAYGFIKGSA